ncbi:MAG: hypothetical protein FWB72_07515, partial [Firmicutes bacterium]|nr:hypothetical protein [Bacillota bacterium]
YVFSPFAGMGAFLVLVAILTACLLVVMIVIFINQAISGTLLEIGLASQILGFTIGFVILSGFLVLLIYLMKSSPMIFTKVTLSKDIAKIAKGRKILLEMTRDQINRIFVHQAGIYRYVVIESIFPVETKPNKKPPKRQFKGFEIWGDKKVIKIVKHFYPDKVEF